MLNVVGVLVYTGAVEYLLKRHDAVELCGIAALRVGQIEKAYIDIAVKQQLAADSLSVGKPSRHLSIEQRIYGGLVGCGYLLAYGELFLTIR